MTDDMNPRKPMRPMPPRRGPNGDEEGNINRIVRSVLVWMTILLGAFIVFMIVRNGGAQPVPVSFNEYQRLLNNGLIARAVIYKSQLNDFDFHGELTEPSEVT